MTRCVALPDALKPRSRLRRGLRCRGYRLWGQDLPSGPRRAGRV